LLPSLLPPSPMPLGYQFVVDARVVLFTLGVSLLTVVIFGVLPAAMASRPDVVALLRTGTRTSGASRQRAVARHLLVAGQFAASLMLVAAAGLFVQSLGVRPDRHRFRAPLVIVTALWRRRLRGDRGPTSRALVLSRVTAAPGSNRWRRDACPAS
jgi:hypothetical protein